MQKSILIVLFVAICNMTQAQVWDANHLAVTINHIKKAVTPKGDTWEFDVTNHESITLSEAGEEKIITITTKEWSATLFVNEKSDFKGNIATIAMKPVAFDEDTVYIPADYRYFFRLTVVERRTIIGKVEKYLSDFATKKPKMWIAPPPVGLFEANDQVTKEFLQFIAFITKNGKNEDNEFVWEKNEDVSIQWSPSLLFLYVFEKENLTMIVFKKDKHVSEGIIVEDDGSRKKVNEDQLRKIFKLIK